NISSPLFFVSAQPARAQFGEMCAESCAVLRRAGCMPMSVMSGMLKKGTRKGAKGIGVIG
ncbi:hypothetical protein RI537_10695, partial [Aeromonas salmonicida]|uniref:hypothetical protein n=1 Tax=Aeromonas salmonicida TaxID=645 RepID=UPI00342EA6B1